MRCSDQKVKWPGVLLCRKDCEAKWWPGSSAAHEEPPGVMAVVAGAVEEAKVHKHWRTHKLEEAIGISWEHNTHTKYPVVVAQPRGARARTTTETTSKRKKRSEPATGSRTSGRKKQVKGGGDIRKLMSPASS